MYWEYIGSCVNNPFKTLAKINEVIDNSIEITSKTFFKYVDDPELIKAFKEYPYDFRFYRYYLLKIYYYKWSGIEYFYKIKN